MNKYFSRIMIVVAVAVFAAMLFPGSAEAALTTGTVTLDYPTGGGTTWGGATATAAVTLTDGDNWVATSYRWESDAAWNCLNHNDVATSGQQTFDLRVDPDPLASGTYTLEMRAHTTTGWFSACGFPSETVDFSGEPSVTVAENNPVFPPSCGIDLTIILDESGSIATGAIGDDLRDAVDTLWQTLEGSDSNMSLVEFNTRGRIVPTVENLEVIPANKAAFTAYISPTNPAGVTPSDATYAPEAEVAPNFYTNWEDAFIQASTIISADLLVFISDGEPTTNNDFPDSADPEGNFVDSLDTRHQHIGPAAIEANKIKDDGTRILGLGFPNPPNPTLDMPYFSGPTQFISGTNTISEADYASVDDVDVLAAALRAFVLELCQSSVTVRKLVNDPDDPNNDPSTTTYLAADDWEFTASADPAGSPFSWTKPYVSGASSISGMTGSGSNGTGILLFDWDPEDSALPTAVTISETVQAEYEFVDVTCRDQTTDEIVVDAQTYLPVALDVETNEFVVCVFRNFRSPTAITLEQVGVSSGQSTWIYVAVSAMVVFTAGVIVVLRRKESQTI